MLSSKLMRKQGFELRKQLCSENFAGGRAGIKEREKAAERVCGVNTNVVSSKVYACGYVVKYVCIRSYQRQIHGLLTGKGGRVSLPTVRPASQE